jgi:rsbT antagonist protein RsbS
MAVPILKQGPFLIASIQAALTDTDVIRLQEDVMVQVGRFRSRGIVVDVTALDVMDSFVSRSLRGIAHMTRLRGAETVIVGIQPTVAFAMVRLGMGLDNVHTALDLEEGLEYLQRLLQHGPERQIRR